MPTFTIDAENNIAVRNRTSKTTVSVQAFSCAKEWEKISGEWPASRLAEIWNSFAGVAPFRELRAVKRFTSRAVGVARIWSAIQRLLTQEEELPITERSERKPTQKPVPRTSDRKRIKKAGPEEGSNKKAIVIALMSRAKGATLAEIMETTGWQKHTVRGFVSNLGNKGGVAIESLKNASGERTYRILKLGR
jgi:hypothetical protein